jgi:hypothetical protein
MKKKATKKTLFKFRGDQPRTITVALSREEVLKLANDHVDAADKLPAAFGQYVRNNRKLGQRDLASSRDGYLGMIDDHIRRAKELNDLVKEDA